MSPDQRTPSQSKRKTCWCKWLNLGVESGPPRARQLTSNLLRNSFMAAESPLRYFAIDIVARSYELKRPRGNKNEMFPECISSSAE